MASPSPFTLSFFRKQWSLSCWNTALRPSLRREGIMLCFSMLQYMLGFMVPLMNCSFPVLSAPIQPQTMTLPPPMLDCRQDTLVFVLLTWLRHTRLTPSEPNKFILVSSDNRTWFHRETIIFSDPQRVLCHEVLC